MGIYDLTNKGNLLLFKIQRGTKPLNINNLNYILCYNFFLNELPYPGKVARRDTQIFHSARDVRLRNIHAFYIYIKDKFLIL